jgi:hypothetical protein
MFRVPIQLRRATEAPHIHFLTTTPPHGSPPPWRPRQRRCQHGGRWCSPGQATATRAPGSRPTPTAPVAIWLAPNKQSLPRQAEAPTPRAEAVGVAPVEPPATTQSASDSWGCPLWPGCHSGGRTTPITGRQLGRPPSPLWARFGLMRCSKYWSPARPFPVNRPQCSATSQVRAHHI